MEKTANRCKGCFSALEPGVEVCPKCAYDNRIKNPEDCLPPGSTLDGRFQTGAVVRRNDLTILYQGFDLKRNARVYIEEFMPRVYGGRDPDGTVVVEQKNHARYKTLLSDMADRWKRLAAIKSKALFPIQGIVSQNNTVYSITAYLPAMTLDDFLNRQKVPLDWSQTRTLIMPLFSLVSQIHNLGLVHCGISPENVVVDKKGELRLAGFALPELRTAGTDLPAELFTGYSAPEQYSKSLWQGEWTDIYSLGAILYRTLTNEDPASAAGRDRGSARLSTVKSKAPGVPENVSDAIGKAMETNKKNRFASVDQFTAALLEEAGSNTAIFRPQQVEVYKEKKDFFSPGGSGVMGGLGLSLVANIALVVMMALGLTLFPQQVLPEPDPVATVEHNFLGMYYPSIKGVYKDLGELVLRVEYEYSEEVAEGVVYEQSAAPGDPMPEDHTIILTVSRGSRFFKMPNLEGCSETYAILLLGQLGLEWDDVRYSAELNVPVGTVVCNIPPGTKMAVGDKVILTVMTGPEGRTTD